MRTLPRFLAILFRALVSREDRAVLFNPPKRKRYAPGATLILHDALGPYESKPPSLN